MDKENRCMLMARLKNKETGATIDSGNDMSQIEFSKV